MASKQCSEDDSHHHDHHHGDDDHHDHHHDNQHDHHHGDQHEHHHSDSGHVHLQGRDEHCHGHHGEAADHGLAEWSEFWHEGDTPPWHEAEVHPCLKQYIDRLVAGREHIKIMVPLCGKSIDIKWLADLGHTVVGVEGATKAVEDFFTENKVSFTKESVEAIDGTLYKSADGKIRMYCGDFFKFNQSLEGQFDGIWDRGSLVAIEPAVNHKYVDLMLSLMAPGCCYFLETLDYNTDEYPGPPNKYSQKDLEDIFGAKCTIELLDTEDARSGKFKSCSKIDGKVSYMNVNLSLLTLK